MQAAFPCTEDGEFDPVPSDLDDLLGTSLSSIGNLGLSFDLPDVDAASMFQTLQPPANSTVPLKIITTPPSNVPLPYTNKQKNPEDLEQSTNPNPNINPSSNGQNGPAEGRARNKPQSNAERCRKHRERKRLAEKKVYEDNKNLKRERAELLHSIAQLEYEAQALRGQGYVNISLENELLKKEIKRHRGYIERFADIAKEAMEETAEEEKKRLMTSSVDSAVGQIMGLAYSSIHDGSWRKPGASEICLSEESGVSVPVQTRYQILPTGASFQEADRLCLRFDIGPLPFSVDELVQLEMLRSKGTVVMRDRIAEMHPELTVDASEVFPYQEVGTNGESVRCVRISFTREDKQEKIRKTMLQLASLRSGEFHKDAFPEDDTGVFPAQAKMLINTTCSLKPLIQTYLSDEPEANVMQACAIKCMILRHSGENKTLCTVIGTFPLRAGVFGGEMRKKLLNEDDLVTHISQPMGRLWKHTYRTLRVKKEE